MANQPQNQMTTSQQAAPKPPAQILEGLLENKHKDQIQALLGPNGDFEQFKQVTMLAVMKSPDLLDCTPPSMIQSCLACANDGLKPDGREAALVKYGDKVQYLPMVYGIILALNRTGMIKDIQVDVVYRGEHFVNVQGSNSYIEHHPGLERDSDAEIIGAYCVIKTKAGGEFKRAMGRKEIDKVKNIAKSKNVWTAWYAEMAKKTVIRNLSKILPKELQLAVLTRDDDLYDLNKANVAVTRTVALEHKAQDIIEPEPPVSPPPPPNHNKEAQGQNGGKARNDTPQPSGAPVNGSAVDLDDDLPPHIRDAPPIEGEVVDPPAADDDDFPGDRKSTPGEGPTAPPLIIWAMERLVLAKTWADIERLMGNLWAHADWPAVESAKAHIGFYALIKTGPIWKTADQDSIIYRRMSRT